MGRDLNSGGERAAIPPVAIGCMRIASAWILRHPAGIQIVSGTTNESRLREIAAGDSIRLTREEWYRLYLAAGHILP